MHSHVTARTRLAGLLAAAATGTLLTGCATSPADAASIRPADATAHTANGLTGILTPNRAAVEMDTSTPETFGEYTQQLVK